MNELIDIKKRYAIKRFMRKIKDIKDALDLEAFIEELEEDYKLNYQELQTIRNYINSTKKRDYL